MVLVYRKVKLTPKPVPGTISWHVKVKPRKEEGHDSQLMSVLHVRTGSPQLGSWRAPSSPGVAAAMAAPTLMAPMAIVMTTAVKRML